MLNIERVLRAKGITQGDLARMLGVSPQAVNSAVCGRSNTSRKLLTRYAKVLDVSVDDLFDDYL